MHGFLRRLERHLIVGPPRQRQQTRPETTVPAERDPIARRRVATAYVLAVVLPLGCALAMVPIRDEHAQVVALVLLVPVIAIASMGSVGPTIVAALTGGIAYGIVHTEPHWRVAIDDADDVATTAALLLVGLTVGLLFSRVVHLRASDEVRHRELDLLVGFARMATMEPVDPGSLADEACWRLTELLALRECRWRPGYHGAAGAVLHPTGAMTGSPSDLGTDRATLPAHIEVPALHGGRELGRFVLTGDRAHLVSLEERLTAATIVGLFAAAIGGD